MEFISRHSQTGLQIWSPKLIDFWHLDGVVAQLNWRGCNVLYLDFQTLNGIFDVNVFIFWQLLTPSNKATHLLKSLQQGYTSGQKNVDWLLAPWGDAMDPPPAPSKVSNFKMNCWQKYFPFFDIFLRSSARLYIKQGHRDNQPNLD